MPRRPAQPRRSIALFPTRDLACRSRRRNKVKVRFPRSCVLCTEDFCISEILCFRLMLLLLATHPASAARGVADRSPEPSPTAPRLTTVTLGLEHRDGAPAVAIGKIRILSGVICPVPTLLPTLISPLLDSFQVQEITSPQS